MTGVDKGFVCHSAAARTFLHSISLIMMEYPSRSNLKCVFSFTRSSAQGDEFRFHSGLSTSVEWEKPLSISLEVGLHSVTMACTSPQGLNPIPLFVLGRGIEPLLPG